MFLFLFLLLLLVPAFRKRVTTLSSGSDVLITQPLLQQQQRVTSTGTLTDDLRPQSILKQQPPAMQQQTVQTEGLYQQQQQQQSGRRSQHASNKSLNEYNNGGVNSSINCQQHTPKCTPVRQHQESFTDNLRHSTLITHSNSELNQVCPHGKGSSKSKWRDFVNISLLLLSRFPGH